MRIYARARRRMIKYSIFAGIFCLFLLNLFFQPFVHLFPGEKVTAPQTHEAEQIFSRRELLFEDYWRLLVQTGLGKPAVDRLRENPVQGKKLLLEIQKQYLEKRETVCRSGTLFTKQDLAEEHVKRRRILVDLEDGDILITFCSHSFGWRHGHAGLVVDAKRGKCLEAVTPGSVSCIKNVAHWKRYGEFAVLRLEKAPASVRKKAARFALENLTGVPYSLTSGFGKGENAAQCAYLVWRAFAHVGYDLDADGRHPVTVKDLAGSRALSVVQILK